MNSPNVASKTFVKNRAEELGMDLWNEFIIPLYFDKLAVDEVGKPLVIEGGRGCGKTTLLRYLSFETQLSMKRSLNKGNLPKQIGIYYRADTHYLRSFRGDTLSESNWQRAFEHDLCLSITQSILASLCLLIKGAGREKEFGQIAQINFADYSDFDAQAPVNLIELTKYIKQQRNKFAMWLNNPESIPQPSFLPIKTVLLTLIGLIRSQIDFLEKIEFFVYIDEYENLLEYQMRAINTHLKHSESPLIFHVATKRNGMATRNTIGDEQLQERDDFRRIDIEENAEIDFNLFAAELFCFRLRKNGFNVGPDIINDELLCSIERVRERRENQTYRDQTIDAAKSILPGLTNPEAANYVFNDATLLGKLKRNLEDVLSKTDSSLKAEQFMLSNVPMESICSTAIIHQGKSPKEVLGELQAASDRKTNKFKSAEWTHHYFTGCMYYLFMSIPRPCVLYAGFDSFLRLSRGNTRHFLELCHLSMQNAVIESGSLRPISIDAQSASARSASAMFIKETQGSGDHGNRLFHIVNTLGQIFRLSQARPSQSEAERTHFAIGNGDINDTTSKILSECVKWSIIFVVPETKVKGTRLEFQDYIFNPIFAPYFGISFNKGRKLEIKPASFETLVNGNRESMDGLIKEYAKIWQLSVQDQLSLFQGDQP